MKKVLLATLLAGSLSGVAMAGTSTSTVTVQVKLLEGCEITTAPLVFGDASLISGDSASVIQKVYCTPGLTYTATIEDATTPTNNAFKMTNAGGDTIDVQFFQDTSRTLPWTSTAGKTITATGSGAGDSVRVEGYIPAQATKPSGAYSAPLNFVVKFVN